MCQGTFVPHDQPPAVIHPGKAALAFPALAVPRSSGQGATPLRALPSACHRRNGGLDASPAQITAEGLAVLRLVGHQLLGPRTRPPAPPGHLYHGQRGLGQLTLMRLGTGDIQSKGQAMAVSDDHYFGAFPHCGLADARSPFFAGTKLPSRKACAHSSLPWASNWLNSTRQIRSQVPSAAQPEKRRQQVAGEPYLRGTSSQAQPVFNTKRIPLSVVRSSFRLRPGPALCLGIRGAMTVHWSSVMSCRLMPQV